MYHSITFGDKNTWDDWHLIPSSRPVFSPPPLNSNEVAIPFGNGVIDLTENLTGYPTYGNRSGSIEFYVANDYWDWTVAYSTISNYLHGRYMRAVLEDDPGYFYEGRFKVNSWKSEKTNSMIVIDYSVYPYKKDISSSSEDWLWDPFNFESSIIRSYGTITVNGTKTIDIYGSEEPVYPSITVSANMTMTCNNKTYSLVTGKVNKLYSLRLVNGANTLVFTGNGTVTIDYRGGSL